ncbi:MAG: pilus assembly protein, partial [Bdellovibrionales bacterium]|nr:pilus assembly protein [Bdellovibrionales bacterium]
MKKHVGVILVELTLILPIFLALLLLFYWFGLIMQGRETLVDSVGQAVHRAKTRGNFLAMGFAPDDPANRGLVQTIDAFYDSGSVSFPTRLRELLSTEDIRQSGTGIEQRYRQYLSEACEYREDPSNGNVYQACF